MAPHVGHYRTLTLNDDCFKRTKMLDKRINNSAKSYYLDVNRVSRSHDQDGRHAHIW